MDILYIGLRGLAGSGKDTTARMLRYILTNYTESKESCKEGFFKNESYLGLDNNVYTIAFADQLKKMCSMMFGVPLEAFYNGSKGNAWVRINRDFKYTEIRPTEKIVTADEYFSQTFEEPVWMSIREVMVYFGTYILQQTISKNVFVNIVENTIQKEYRKNNYYKYLLCTDVRFEHEMNYIKNHKGIVINITRDSVSALNNIAELSLDDDADYDFEIVNNGTYEELFDQIYNLVHSNYIFRNNIIHVETRDFDSKNYIRLIGEDIYEFCTEDGIQSILRENGEIVKINPIGGPTLEINKQISGTNLIPSKLIYDVDKDKIIIYK